MHRAPLAADSVDQQVVARAYRKVMDKAELSRDEQAALKRHERGKEERLRWQYYRSIPQKHWREMSGRQTKVLNEQASRYGLPLGGPIISLPELARAFHDFLAANALKLAGEDPLLTGTSSPALEDYRRERAALAKLERQERERRLLPREEVRQTLARIAAVLRAAGDSLQRQYGPDALNILREALLDAERDIEHHFGDQEAADGQDAPPTPE